MLKDECMKLYKRKNRKSRLQTNHKFFGRIFKQIQDAKKYCEKHFKIILAGDDFFFENINGEMLLVLEFEDLKMHYRSDDKSAYGYDHYEGLHMIQECCRQFCHNLVIGDKIHSKYDIGRIFCSDYPNDASYAVCEKCKNEDRSYQTESREKDAERINRELGDLLREIMGEEEF